MTMTNAEQRNLIAADIRRLRNLVPPLPLRAIPRGFLLNQIRQVQFRVPNEARL